MASPLCPYDTNVEWFRVIDSTRMIWIEFYSLCGVRWRAPSDQSAHFEFIGIHGNYPTKRLSNLQYR